MEESEINEFQEAHSMLIDRSLVHELYIGKDPGEILSNSKENSFGKIRFDTGAARTVGETS